MESKFSLLWTPERQEEIEKNESDAENNQDFFAAALIRFSIIDAALRAFLSLKLEVKGREFDQYWNDTKTSTLQLIKNCHLLALPYPLVNDLKNYNQDRNELVHNLMLKSQAEIINLSKKHHNTGKVLFAKLFNEINDIDCPCGSGKSLKECNDHRTR